MTIDIAPVEKKVISYAPNFFIRLALWIFIYLGAQGILMRLFYLDSESISKGSPETAPDGFSIPLFLLFFPFGLLPQLPYFGHVFYLCHLIYSLIIRRQTFYYLGLVILVGALLLNVVTCSAMNEQLKHFSP